MNIGPLIKKAREQSGKTLEDVAKIVGVSPATISRYESGEIKNMRRDSFTCTSLRSVSFILNGLER